MTTAAQTLIAPKFTDELEVAAKGVYDAGMAVDLAGYRFIVASWNYITASMASVEGRVPTGAMFSLTSGKCVARYMEIRKALGKGAKTVSRDGTYLTKIFSHLIKGTQLALDYLTPPTPANPNRGIGGLYDRLLVSERPTPLVPPTNVVAPVAPVSTTPPVVTEAHAPTVTAPVAPARSVTVAVDPEALYNAAEALVKQLEALGAEGLPWLRTLAARIVEPK